MNTTPMLLVLAALPLVGGLAWLAAAFATVHRNLRGFRGFDGMHFETAADLRAETP